MTSKEIVATSKLQRYVPPQPPPEMLYFDAGGSTFHMHTCDQESHSWMCNSPYCNSLKGLCPDHGGPEPVSIGREPWRR